ncbi:MAG: ABC transporter substrate-binding protein, partial [Burkholderiales bacterium PBB5]
CAFADVSTATQHIAAGKLRPLVVSGERRAPLLATVPTLAESGYRGFEALGWVGVLLAAGTPKPIVEKLNKALNEARNDKDIIKRIEDHGADVQGSTPDELALLVKSELAKWKRVVQAAKLSAD